MSLLVRPFLCLAVTLLIYTLVVLSSFSHLALAQEPSPFEISVVPRAEYAVAGTPFTYTVVITNVSQIPLKDVIIKARTPYGTTFLDTRYTNVNWSIRGFRRGEPGEIFWFTQDPVAPGEVVTFELIVNVLPGLDQEIINEGYTIAIGSIDNIVISGFPIKTQVLVLSPTATSVPSSTATTGTPILAATSLHATPISQAAPNITGTARLATPTATLLASQTDSAAASTATLASLETSQNAASETASSATIMFVIIGFSVLVVAIIGLTWFLGKR